MTEIKEIEEIKDASLYEEITDEIPVEIVEELIIENDGKLFPVQIEKGPKSYGASSPGLPGCFGVGNTLEEARKNLQAAIPEHLEALNAKVESKKVKITIGHEEYLALVYQKGDLYVGNIVGIEGAEIVAESEKEVIEEMEKVAKVLLELQERE